MTEDEKHFFDVNAAASGGRITADLLDETGEVVGGCEDDTCQPFGGDSLDHTIRWTGSVGAGSDACLSVRLRPRNAEIFSVWFG